MTAANTFGHDFFCDVIAFHETNKHSWEEISKRIPTMPKGWMELCALQREDRIEFTRLFWQQTLEGLTFDCSDYVRRLDLFFARITNIEVFATKTLPNMPYEVQMIYTWGDDEYFFYGAAPARTEAIEQVTRQFGQLLLPADFLSFYCIHDGFCSLLDGGVIPTNHLARRHREFQENCQLDPLLPFYESTQPDRFQCFFVHNKRQTKMGNVSYCQMDPTVDQTELFSTFNEWLLYYLEKL